MSKYWLLYAFFATIVHSAKAYVARDTYFYVSADEARQKFPVGGSDYPLDCIISTEENSVVGTSLIKQAKRA